MSEFLTIDTEAGLTKKEELLPLPLYDEKHFMLNQVMPEYKDVLPNPNMSRLVSRLKMTRKLYGGLGLSANQCGVQERVFVIGTDQFEIVCINPKILSASADLDKSSEGCLSFPGLYVKIARPSWVEVEFTNENGEVKQVKLDGLTARCFAHELDHMNGKKFVSYVGDVALQMARKKQSKLMKKYTRRK
jgi:peptide deformylase